MNQFAQLQWPLIVGVGALALIRPLLNITGAMDWLGRPFGPLLVTALISLLWIVIVVFVRARRPILTLLCSGLVYGVFAIVLSIFASPLVDGRLLGPITNWAALVSVLITNALWGALTGLIAQAVLALRR